MTRLLIHIGMEKSGSSSIQAALLAGRRLLRRKGITYPKTGKQLEHNFLTSSYMPPDSARQSRGLNRYPLNERTERAARFRKILLASIRKANRAIISGEHLFRMEPAEVASFKSDLDDLKICDILVVGYLRDPVSLYLSLAQQELKGDSKILQPSDFHIPYRRRVEGWQQSFKCRFFNFDEARATDGGLTGHFKQVASAFFQSELSALRTPQDASNETISAEEMKILQDFRQFNFASVDGVLNW